MKIILAAVSLAAMVLAESPPSNSYLPPPPGKSNQGYPRGGPKSLSLEEVQPTGNPFGRPARDPLTQIKYKPENKPEEEGYDRNAASFGQNVLDGEDGTSKYENDERGYKPRVSFEDSENPSGYDVNANKQKGPKGFGGRTGNHSNHGYHGNGHHSNGKHNNGRQGNVKGYEDGNRASATRDESDY